MAKSKIKTAVWAVCLLAVAAGGYGYFRYRQANKDPGMRFETVKVKRGSVVGKVTATGTLSALITVQVGSQVSGRIKEILVDYNSQVTKGQVLARIDRQLFEAAIEQSRANFIAAQGNLVKAQVQSIDADRRFQRAKALADRKLIAQADLDTAQADADAAKAQVEAARGGVEQAKAALNQAQINLAYTTIVSPINGIVISRAVDVGQTVAASLQAPTLFIIAEDLRKMQVDTSVAEADVGKLREGMAAEFAVDAYPSERFKGIVRQIRNSPQTVQNVVTYDAVIDVANPEFKLRPGMTANVTFVYADRSDVLVIPNSALRFKPADDVMTKLGVALDSLKRARSNEPKDRKIVWVLRGKIPESVAIRGGVTDGSLTEVVEGELNDGDTVITDVTGVPKNTGFMMGGRVPFR